MASPLTCTICSAPTNYAHLGINACRSCADFYKRTVNAERSFVCRQGNGKCTINQRDRHNCRGCRFEKCKELGMKLVDQKPSDCEAQPLEPSISQPVNETLIALVAREYLASVERRKISELSLRPTSLNRHIRANVPGKDLMLCSWTFLMDSLKTSAGDYIVFASACFPEFAALTLDDRRLMLRNFASRLYLLECQCGTFRHFGSYDGPYYMATLTTCHDSRNFKFFIEEEIPTSYFEIVQ